MSVLIYLKLNGLYSELVGPRPNLPDANKVEFHPMNSKHTLSPHKKKNNRMSRLFFYNLFRYDIEEFFLISPHFEL